MLVSCFTQTRLNCHVKIPVSKQLMCWTRGKHPAGTHVNNTAANGGRPTNTAKLMLALSLSLSLSLSLLHTQIRSLSFTLHCITDMRCSFSAVTVNTYFFRQLVSLLNVRVRVNIRGRASPPTTPGALILPAADGRASQMSGNPYGQPHCIYSGTLAIIL